MCGFAYDPWEFGPSLWIFDQGDGDHQVHGIFGILFDRCGFHPFCERERNSSGTRERVCGWKLVAYALNITDLDPIEFDLIFERFLNPGRKSSMPDVDVDFCMDRRDEVIQYVMGKYGKENVAQIITSEKCRREL
jgi:hypothetical protein